jgi:hypothetical protein
LNEGIKPVYLASIDTDDPFIRGLAELIFWTDQLSEHSHFMSAFLPIEALSLEHEQAIKFKGAYEAMFRRALKTNLDQAEIMSLSSDFSDLTEDLVGFKRHLAGRQRSGKIHSLLWPSFLDHLVNEASHYRDRQQLFMRGEVRYDRDEVIDFGAHIMAEHAEFVANFLDTAEKALHEKLVKASAVFREIEDKHPLEKNRDPVIQAINATVEFKTSALKEFQAGRIQGMVTPMMVDHARREELFFLEELKKADVTIGIPAEAA